MNKNRFLFTALMSTSLLIAAAYAEAATATPSPSPSPSATPLRVPQTVPLQGPLIGAVMPNMGTPGSTSTVKGRGFDRNTYIVFDGTTGMALRARTWTANTLTFIVPYLQPGVHFMQLAVAGNMSIPMSRQYVFVITSPGPLITSASQAPKPRASLTSDGQNTLNYKVGETAHFLWTSAYANDYSSTVTKTGPATCPSDSPISPSTAEGHADFTFTPIYAGCSWTITYTATNEQNGFNNLTQSSYLDMSNAAKDTLTVKVVD